MRKIKSVFAGLLSLALMLSFVFVISGCGGGDDEPKSLPVGNDLTAPFFGSVLGKVIGGIVSGAEGKIGGEAMGAILQLLGWGGGDSDQAALTAMNTRLDQIVDTLNLIENDLKMLGVNLILAKDEILANINDPTAAITRIGTAQDDLVDLATGKQAGDVNQAEVLAYANKVENVYLTENDVSTIHDAIIPPTIVKTPVLNIYVNYRIASPSPSLFESYRGLEVYFSQLVYNQIKGVNLVVEAKTALEKAGILSAGSARTYMDNFRKNKLKPEVDNFLFNTRRLILSQVDLVNGNSQFLPADAQKILERADFLAVQILLQDHFGLRANLIGTTDLIGGVVSLTAKSRQTGLSVSGTGVLSTAPGKIYDHWVGNQVSGVSDYNVISYDFGPLPNGDYDILDQNGAVLATAAVRSYTADFVIDPAGTISYGNAVFSKRAGAKDAFNTNAVWEVWQWNLRNAALLYATPSDRAAGVRGYVNRYSEKYHGETELAASFVYASTVSAPITIHYAGHASGNLHDTNINYSGISYTIGLMDGTTNSVVQLFKTNAIGKAFFSSVESLDDLIAGSFLFNNPIPGHSYYVYFFCMVDGEGEAGDASASIKLTEITGNVYITF